MRVRRRHTGPLAVALLEAKSLESTPKKAKRPQPRPDPREGLVVGLASLIVVQISSTESLPSENNARMWKNLDETVPNTQPSG